MDFPKLRYVEVFPVDTDDGQMVGVRDPQNIASETLVISPDVYYLLYYLDGRHSWEEIKQEYKAGCAKALDDEDLHEILGHLDKHYFLDNDNFADRLKRLEQNFLDLPARPTAHAGQSYEAAPDALAAQIDGFFENPEGAGKPVMNGAATMPIKGLVAPHIDVRLGGPCYSHAYRALLESAGADCFVILGTGHSGLAGLYSTLAKDFDTPFGPVRHDAGFIKLLEKNYPAIGQSEVLPHRTEHVIEFQVIFLKHLLRNFPDFTIVPLLCSFSYHALTDPRFAREKKIVETFSKALKATIEQFDKRVCLIASVDFCHVGPRYGDPASPDVAFLKKVSQFDKSLFKHIEKLDADAFCNTVAAEQDKYRVCGFSSVYTMLNAIDASKVRMLNYADTTVDNQNSKVTFASMSFH